MRERERGGGDAVSNDSHSNNMGNHVFWLSSFKFKTFLVTASLLESQRIAEIKYPTGNNF